MLFQDMSIEFKSLDSLLKGLEQKPAIPVQPVRFYSPLVMSSKAVLDSGFHAVDFRFQVLDSGNRFQWIPDSFFSWILDSTSKGVLDSGIRITLHGAISLYCYSLIYSGERLKLETSVFYGG